MINFEALFNVTYGMYIVCSGKGDEGNGFISNSVFQVTAEPPQFAVCCNKENFTAELIKNTKSFSISVLKDETLTTLIGRFGYKSGKDFDKLEGINIKTGETGIPIVLNDSLSYVECKLGQTVDAGTHYIFIGEVINADVIVKGSPLTYAYYRNIKKGIAPKNAPTYIDKSKLSETKKVEESKKYKCSICGHVYDPDLGDEDYGIPKGTKFEDLPDDWKCPVCGAEKDDFVEI